MDLFRPFLAVGVVVSLLVAAISIYVSPWGLRQLRLWATEVRADLVTTSCSPAASPSSKSGSRCTFANGGRTDNCWAS